MPVQGATDYTINHDQAVDGAVVDGQLKNTRSAAAEGAIPFGRVVSRGTTVDGQAKLPSSAALVAQCLGVAVRQQDDVANASDVLQYEDEDAGITILDFGDIWMEAEDAVVAGQTAFVNWQNGDEGKVRSDAGGGDAAEQPEMTFMSSTGGANELVKVRVRLVTGA